MERPEPDMCFSGGIESRFACGTRKSQIAWIHDICHGEAEDDQFHVEKGVQLQQTFLDFRRMWALLKKRTK